MAKVTYLDHNARSYVVEVERGVSLMQAALDNSVPNILGDCGGAAACATCHVQVHPEWIEAVGKASELEQDMLEGLLEVTETSRLACQILMSDSLDGLLVQLPEQQL